MGRRACADGRRSRALASRRCRGARPVRNLAWRMAHLVPRPAAWARRRERRMAVLVRGDAALRVRSWWCSAKRRRSACDPSSPSCRHRHRRSSLLERERGWTPAGELLPGDEVFTSRGGRARIGGGTWIAGEQLVYNFEVEGAHTYFVGETGAWVHNSCFGSGRGPHHADYLVTGPNGARMGSASSGGMTAAESALGFPRSSLATHTEARVAPTVRAGERMTSMVPTHHALVAEGR